MKQLIGFSLSLCISDILDGRVKLEEVHFIQSGCAPRNEDDVRAIIEQYSNTYTAWRKQPDKAREVFNALRAEHRIGWASAFEKNCCNIAWGHWLEIQSLYGKRSICTPS